MKEALLESLLRQMRLRRVYPVIARYPGCRLLDVGCGWEARLLRTASPQLAIGVGIDRKAPAIQGGKLRTLQCDLEADLPFESASFDAATMPMLEFLAFRLGIDSAAEIADHERYWNNGELFETAAQFGFNSSCVLRRPGG